MALQWIEYLKQSGLMDLLKVGSVAGIVSSVITLIWNGVRDAKTSKREARHVALTVALSLENYARDAKRMMHRADWARQETIREHNFAPLENVGLPEFAFPQPLDWKWLNHRIASQLREFPASLHSIRQFLSSEWEYGDPLDWCEEVEFECAKAIKQALELSRMTRVRHGVAPWMPGALDADMEKELTQYIAEYGAKREVFREKQRRSKGNIMDDEATPGRQ
jgi:hypothetical protein